MERITKFLLETEEKVAHQNTLMGWRDAERSIAQEVILINSEIGEATEGLRKGIADDHLPDFPMYAVELADVIIRSLDLSSKLNVDWDLMDEDTLKRVKVEEEAEYNLARMLTLVADVFIHRTNSDGGKGINCLQLMRLCVLAYKSIQQAGLCPEKLIQLKMDYNLNRADHKPENRAKEGGKKW